MAMIEKAQDGGFGIFSMNDEHCYGYGLTMDEAKSDFLDSLCIQADYYKEKKGEMPQWWSDELDVEYHYDISAFFEAFPFINATAFAKELGINPSLMRKYKNKLCNASSSKKKEIQEKYDQILSKLSLVEF